MSETAIDQGGLTVEKKSVVRLTDDEREILCGVVKKLKGSSPKVRRAQILLKADAAGPGGTDRRIAEAFSGRTQTVESLRQRLVTGGFEGALNGAKRDKPPRPKRLDGAQEARRIALRPGPAPQGFANWSLRLSAGQPIVWEIVESIGHETVRQTLKKTA